MRRIEKSLSASTITALILVALNIPTSSVASVSDTPINLGSVLIDCGSLEDFTVGFTGGSGDYFAIVNKNASHSCSISAPGILTGDSSLPASSAKVYTAVSAGEFSVTGNGVTRTGTLSAHPIFANEGTNPDNQIIGISCNETSSRYLGRVITYGQIGDRFVLSNDSSSRSCTVLDPNNILTGEGEVPKDGTLTLTVNASGSFTLKGSLVDSDAATFGPDLVFSLSQGNQRGDVTLGSALAANGSLLYSQVFHSNGQVYDARVTVTETSGLVSNEVEILDENQNPAGPNFPLSPKIRVSNESAGGFATIKIEFFQSGTSNPVSLPSSTVTVVDIDSYQFVEARSVTSYELSSDPVSSLIATASQGTVRVSEPAGNSSNDSQQNHWAVFKFGPRSELTFTFGAAAYGVSSSSESASFGLLFRSMDFTNPPAQQVVEVPVTNPAPQSAATATALAATGSDGGVSQIWLMVAASFVLAGSALLYLRRRASLDTKK